MTSGATLTPPGRVGVVGAGAFGRFCIDAYSRTPDIHVVAAADPQIEALQLIRLPDVRLETDWHALVASPDIEVVHVATPPFLRAEIVAYAVSQGKSVFCEKPLALSLQEADSMINVAHMAGVALGVDYVMRYHPAYALLVALAESHLLGDLRTISFQNFAQHVPPEHWFWDVRRSGGILVEHGVHFFDAYSRIAGSPRSVRAVRPRAESIDVAVEYENDVFGRFYHEFAFPSSVERTTGTAFFSEGFVEIEGWIPTRLTGAALVEPDVVQRIAADLNLDLVLERDKATRFSIAFGDRNRGYADLIVAGMHDVLNAHRDRNYRMQVSAQDARNSLALAIAGQQGAASGEGVTLG